MSHWFWKLTIVTTLFTFLKLWCYISICYFTASHLNRKKLDVLWAMVNSNFENTPIICSPPSSNGWNIQLSVNFCLIIIMYSLKIYFQTLRFHWIKGFNFQINSFQFIWPERTLKDDHLMIRSTCLMNLHYCRLHTQQM